VVYQGELGPHFAYGGAMRSLSSLVCVLWACGGGGGHAMPDAGVDAPAIPIDADFGAPSSTYPAYPNGAPQIGKQATGVVLTSPRVVAAYYSDETEASTLQDFLGKFAASSYWSTMVGEYGVGPLTIAAPITLTIPTPSTLTDSQLTSWLGTQLDGTHPEWGPVDAGTLNQTIFAFHFPGTTTVTLGQLTSCVNFNGYHQAFLMPGGIRVAYMVVIDCPGTTYVPNVLDLATAAYAHELVEATTDPQPFTGYDAIDARKEEWALDYGAELGDLCELLANSWFKPTDLGYMIQRTWSNASALAAHDPCVPVPPFNAQYYASIPRQNETVFVPNSPTGADGINLAVGESKTVEVDLTSDGPTGAWTLSAVSDADVGSQPATLSFAFDRTSGVNGQKVHLTITAVRRPTRGFELYRIVSKLQNRITAWWGLVGISP
jgi:hypothetical protein